MSKANYPKIKNKPKAILIGPVSPYRGGIAKYTESLAQSLRSFFDVSVVSFSRQYPKILYPGKSDLVADAKWLDDVDYSLDSNNPISWHRVAKKIIDRNPDLVLINWWTLFWQPGFAYITKKLRKRGIKVVYICHNLYDHDASAIKKSIGKKLLSGASGYIVHARDQQKLLAHFFPKAKILNRIHPIYDQFPKVKAKDIQLSKNRINLLFIGLIRPYKGLDVLIEAYKKLDSNKYDLTVVGESWSKSDDISAKLDDVGATKDLRFVSDYEMGAYVSNADVVVLPYISATGSGVVNVAYYYKKPVIASAVGGLKEAVIDNKTGWLFPSGDSAQLVEIIENKVTKTNINKMRGNIENFANKNSWHEFSKAIKKTFIC